MQEVVERRWGSLDVETRCMKENVERQGGEPDVKQDACKMFVKGLGLGGFYGRWEV